MDELSLPIKLILAFVLGGVIGLEREINEKKLLTSDHKLTAILGLRSFSLITGLGAIAGVLYPRFPFLSLVVSIGFLGLLFIFYKLDSAASKDMGLTTELAMIFSFVIGILVVLNVIPVQITLALTVVLILLLSRKRQIKQFISDIKNEEINAFIGFAVIALVILPFLPNTSYALSDIPNFVEYFKKLGVNVTQIATIDIINPFKLWLIVALITGVDMAGYILAKTMGKTKGWMLTSFIGGFVSSTATTQSLALQSKESERINHLLAAALFANLASFIQIGILILPVNPDFFVALLPVLLVLIATSLLLAFFFATTKGGSAPKTEEDALTKEEIFSIAPALKFAALFFFVTVFSKVAFTLFGREGFLIASGLASFAGIDAVMINTASLAQQTISFETGLLAFVLVNSVNLLGKATYSFLQGKREFALKFFFSVIVIICASLFAVVLL